MGREVIDKVGLGDRPTHRRASSRAASSSASPSPARSSSRPTVVFADEPTGNLDSTTSGEILDLLRDSVDDYGQTTLMVTHDADAAAIADRILFLADGHVVEDIGGLRRAHDLRDDRRGEQPMIRARSRACSGRKLRTALTALAVVLGVAMVSGTYVLTDRIDKAFDTLFERSYEDSSAVISGGRSSKYSASGNATVPDSLDEGQAVPQVGDASGAISTQRHLGLAKLLDRDGKPSRRRRAHFGGGSTPRERSASTR